MEEELLAELIKQTKFIGELMKLVNRLGGDVIIKDLVGNMNQGDYINNWTATEIQRGINYLQVRNVHFTKSEVLIIIEKLLTKYQISNEDLQGILAKHNLDSSLKRVG